MVNTEPHGLHKKRADFPHGSENRDTESARIVDNFIGRK